MFTRLALILCCAVSAVGCSPKHEPSPVDQALSTTAHELILPWHQTFVRDTAELQQSLERFCQNPGNPGELEASRQSWRTAMMSWQTLRVINFGPVADGNQAWRLQFWPDTHNRVGQKVEELLAKDTPITAEALAGSNVLVQGLSALEYLLFDPQKAALENYQNLRICEFLTAASQNTANVAKALHSGWAMEGDNYLGVFLSAGEGNIAFPTNRDVVTALASAVVMSVEFVKNRKLGEPFGGRPGGGRMNPYHVELWRSKTSLPAMQTELAADEQLFLKGLKPVLIAEGHADLANRIEQSFGDSRKALSALPAPLFDHVRNEQALPQFQAAWDTLGQLIALLKRDMPDALQIQLGFNSSDGD